MTGLELYNARRRARPRLRAWLAAHPKAKMDEVARAIGYAPSTLEAFLRGGYAKVTERAADNILNFLDNSPGWGKRDKKAAARKTWRAATTRRCHDCGRPTSNYRCAACRAKWAAHNGVSLDGESVDGDWIYA